MPRVKISAAQAPQTREEAIALLERFAVGSARLDALKAHQDEELARIRAACDQASDPLRAELAEIAAQLKAWFTVNRTALTAGRRKSIFLGGCEIGERLGTPALRLPQGTNEQDAIALLEQLEGGAELVRIVKALDRAAIIQLLRSNPQDGLAQQLQAARFAISQSRRFFVDAMPPRDAPPIMAENPDEGDKA